MTATEWVWKLSPNGGTAHLFRRWATDRINVSCCGMKKRELHMLRPAAPDARRCKMCQQRVRADRGDPF